MTSFVLFGPPSIERGGRSFALPFERRSQLVVFLAMKRAWVGRAELAALLWPEQETRLAYTNLRKTLFRLQSAQWLPAIESQGGALRLVAEADVLAFETALREQRIEQALALRRGELLTGYEDDANEAWSSWLAFERDRLRAAWRGAALDHLGTGLDAGRAIDLSARLLAADPLDETALRAHMAWLARGGQSARARQAYRDFVARLEQDLGLPPSADLKALHDSLGSAAPPPAASSAGRVPDAGFVGRAVELRRMVGLLTGEDCRLLSLVGPGGAGKTRLAQRALPELASAHPDGASFVALEDVASRDELVSRLARDLHVRLVGGAEPLDHVVAFLRGRRTLLVLDNFEQLLPAASVLEQLLQACPELRIVVTSRVRLALPGEWLLPVEGLPCPEAEDRDRLETFDAARLFVQAAQRVEPALVPSVEAISIVDICRRVGGLPLALELAAAWTRVLSCDAIAAELRSGTELLHAVDASQPTRHASLAIVFDQSWRLLSAVERDALARLSVFHGGFSAEAGRAVAGAPMPVLGALADKSLLRKEDARIFMHPMVGQLAALRLGDGDARASTERAHAAYFLRLLGELTRGAGAGDRDTLLRIDVEFDNCKAAWRWAVAHDDRDGLRRSARTLEHFCDHRGRFVEGADLLREALDSQAIEADGKLASLLLAATAHLMYRLDDYVEAEALAARGLAAARAARDRDRKSQCLNVLGEVALRLGRLADAKRCFAEARELGLSSTNPQGAAGVLDNLALVEKMMGHDAEALQLSLQSLAAHRRGGDAAGEALCLNNLATLYLVKRDYALAGAHLAQAMAIADRHGLAATRGLLLANLIEVATMTGDLDAAESHARLALELAEGAGNRYLASYVRLHFVQIALRRLNLDSARSELAASLRVAAAMQRPAFLLDGVTLFAEMLRAQDENLCARRVLSFAAGHPSASAMQRNEIRDRLSQLPAGEPETAWPAITLDELVHRIVVESDIAHAPLIAALRSAG